MNPLVFRLARTRALVVGLLLAPLTPALTGQTPDTPAAPPAETFKGEKIFLRDFGGDEVAYLSIPDTAPTLGLVIAPDGHGLGPRVRRFCDALAAAGYLALAVDMTNGRMADSPEGAAALIATVSPAVGAKALEAGLAFYEKSPRFRMDRVALITLGGADALARPLAETRRGRRLTAISMIDPLITGEGPAGDGRVRVQRLHSPAPDSDWAGHLPALRAFWAAPEPRKNWFERLVE